MPPPREKTIGEEIWEAFGLPLADTTYSSLRGNKYTRPLSELYGLFTRGAAIDSKDYDTLILSECDVVTETRRGPIKKRKAYVTFAKTGLDDTIRLNDVDFDADDLHVEGLKGDFAPNFQDIGSFEEVYDNRRFEKAGSADLFLNYRGAQEASLIREEMVKDTVRLLSRYGRTLDERPLYGGKIVQKIVKIEPGLSLNNLGLGAYFTGQAISTSVLNAGYKLLFRGFGKLLRGLPFVGKTISEQMKKNEGVILRKYVEFTDIFNRVLGLPGEVEPGYS